MVNKSEQFSKDGFGVFCEVYGKTLRNRILEYMLEMDELDFAISDIDVKISKPRKYQIVKDFIEERILLESRVVAGTQLYKLNKKDVKVKLLLKSFNDCLKSKRMLSKPLL